MIRLMGAVLVAAGGAFLGFQAAAGLRRRVRAVRQMGAGLALLEQELELNAPPLSACWSGAPPGARVRRRRCFSAVSRVWTTWSGRNFPACGGGWQENTPS